MQTAAPVLAIIGAGTAGRRFALACAAAGYDVVLEDVMPSNLRRAQDEYQELNVSGRLSVALTVEQAVEHADIAVDFVPDELESKLEIFSLMDRMAPPRTIFCTPSDALSITDLASCVYRPDRCFALRGDLTGEGPIRILYPESRNEDALSQVEHLFASLGRIATPETDPDVPMLMKNLTAYR
jgi:3-hydroxybutyryl-CoA dehydrogenase